MNANQNLDALADLMPAGATTADARRMLDILADES